MLKQKVVKTCTCELVSFEIYENMTSSQEKTEKYFHTIEKAIQETKTNENTNILLREYKELLQNEIAIQKENEDKLQENLEKINNIADSSLETKCSKLQEAINDGVKYIEQLRDEIENVTIQYIAEKETLKIEKAEKEKQIISLYGFQIKKLQTQLETNRREHENTEQEIKNQIALELATRNARLEEVRNNLQRQIVEKNSVIIKLQNEHKELVKEFNILKSQQQANKSTTLETNVIEFHNDYLVQPKQSNISKIKTYRGEPNYFELNNTNLPAHDLESNIINDQFNTNKNNQLKNEEISYVAAEFDQFNETLTQSSANVDSRNAILLVPNPYSLDNKAGCTNKNNGCSLLSKNTTQTERPIPISVNSFEVQDIHIIEDAEENNGTLIKKCESFDYESNPPNEPRRGPKVYMGRARQKRFNTR